MFNISETDIAKKKSMYRSYILNLKNLPSIPAIMFEIAKLLDSPRTSAAELGRLISKDQALVAKILTVANSPLYGLPRRVATIEFAIVILGFDHIKNIIIALSMMEAFKNKSDVNWNRKTYWLHSFVTASAAKRIADDLGYLKSGEAFTAGLLHDLGISVIQRFFNKEFQEICSLVKAQQMRYYSAEEIVMGLNHQDIGLILCEKWNLPQTLSDSIANHHFPSKAESNKELASIVHLADYMTQRFSIGNFSWDDNIELDENIISILKLGDINYLNKFIDSYEELFKNQIDSLLN